MLDQLQYFLLTHNQGSLLYSSVVLGLLVW